MNLLYLYGNSIDPEKGGIQRVTHVLSNYFESQGHKVHYVSRMLTGVNVQSPRQNYLPNSISIFVQENIDFLKDFVKKYQIDIVINQSGMDPQLSKLAFTVKETGVKLISCIHNALISQIHYFDTTYAHTAKSINLGWLLPISKINLVKKILLSAYKRKYAKHYTALCEKSDSVVLLSPAFIKELTFFLKKDFKLRNVTAISNPTSFIYINCKKDLMQNKSKNILYVGRIDRRQKRVDLLLDIWELLHLDYPDWNLKIVGGGRDLTILKNDAKRRGLTNLSFDGFQNPENYYRDASIFCMTSAYEGFGIVLAEAMTYGVVPLAFKSYSSVTDIIQDGVSGYLVKPFDVKEYANKLGLLMETSEIRDDFSNSAIKRAEKFSLESIGQHWLKLFEKLV